MKTILPKMMFHDSSGYQNLKPKHFISCTSDGDYCTFVFKKKKKDRDPLDIAKNSVKIIICSNLAAEMKRFGLLPIVQINGSCFINIVNMTDFKSGNPKGSTEEKKGTITMKNGDILKVSEKKQADFNKVMKSFMSIFTPFTISIPPIQK